MAYLSSYMLPTLCLKMKTTGAFAKKEKKRQRRTWLVEETKAYEKENWWVEAPLLLCRMCSATEAQRAKDYEKETNNERQKNEKEGKPPPFISPGRIKSRPLDHVQSTSTVGGLETGSTVGIKGLFRNLNQWSRSRGSETSYTLMMRGVLPNH